MALTNYERVKRWREKHRALYNLQRRNARKNLDADSREGEALKPEENRSVTRACSHPETPLFETKKVGEFRMLVLPEQPKEEATMPVVKPKVFLNDHGAVISERVWEQLQEKKRIAAERGYEFDPQ